MQAQIQGTAGLRDDYTGGLAQLKCQKLRHLFDLRDLFGSRAQKTQKRFAKRLLQKPKAGGEANAGGQMGVAAPGKRVGDLRPIHPKGKITGKRLSRLRGIQLRT